MKQINITIHPFSALAGMALLGLVLVTAGAMPMQGSSSTRDVSAIENVNDPHPRDFVRIVEGAPFSVPAGKVFVGTGTRHTSLIGHGNGTGQYAIVVAFDGVQVLALYSRFAHGGASPPIAFGNLDIPTGFSAVAGTVITVDGVNESPTMDDAGGCLLGYLVDA
jgi:hypothetical protein